MTRRSFAKYLFLHLTPTVDWRWRRAEQLAAGKPGADRYDDDVTLQAVRVLRGEYDPGLDDVRAALAIHQAGGLQQRVLQAYVLTELSAAEIGGKTMLSEGVVDLYETLFFAVRGEDPLARQLHLTVVAGGDRLMRDAARFGPLAVEVRLAIEAGRVSPGWVATAERFEQTDLLDQL